MSLQRAAARLENIDALRGLALLGILQVNVQSFAWGAGDPLGYLSPAPGTLERTLYFLQAAFFEGKAYPIFAFLFGTSLALQMRKLRDAGHQGALRAQRRRLLVLLALGVVHGLVLYCGDVLFAYALCGLLMITCVPARARELLRLVRWTWLAAGASLFVPAILVAALGWNAAPEQIPVWARQAHEVYCRGGFFAQMAQRASDELWQQLGSIPTFWPQLFALFSLGILAGRLGLLQHPQRHARAWRWAAAVGLLLGLPLSLAGAQLTLARASQLPGAQGGWDEIVLGAGSLLSLAYVAAAIWVFQQRWSEPVQSWLASAGRMSLSNYVAQSLAMGLLLSGWGLGLGQSAGRAQLALLALLIFVGQVLASRWVLRLFSQGPLEALWRRWSYG